MIDPEFAGMWNEVLCGLGLDATAPIDPDLDAPRPADPDILPFLDDGWGAGEMDVPRLDERACRRPTFDPHAWFRGENGEDWALPLVTAGRLASDPGLRDALADVATFEVRDDAADLEAQAGRLRQWIGRVRALAEALLRANYDLDAWDAARVVPGGLDGCDEMAPAIAAAAGHLAPEAVAMAQARGVLSPN